MSLTVNSEDQPNNPKSTLDHNPQNPDSLLFRSTVFVVHCHASHNTKNNASNSQSQSSKRYHLFPTTNENGVAAIRQPKIRYMKKDVIYEPLEGTSLDDEDDNEDDDEGKVVSTFI